ncbi:hypothetical protein LINPERPRIM_LOCUS29203 [Linum perenne]
MKLNELSTMATVLETRAKLMLRGGQFDVGDDLIKKAIFIRASICGENHPETVAARETLSDIPVLFEDDVFTDPRARLEENEPGIQNSTASGWKLAVE